MEKRTLVLNGWSKRTVIGVVCAIGALSFAAGMLWSKKAFAHEKKKPRYGLSQQDSAGLRRCRDSRGSAESGEFYFQHRPEDKMDSLVKRRKNFHREMLRDVVLSK